MFTASKKLWFWFRQPLSGVSHLAGAVLATGGLIWLAETSESSRALGAAVIFGSTMILLFVASALYHLLPLSEKSIQRLRRFDHSSIYLFIAGSYTPVCLLLLHGPKAHLILGIVWAIAITGVLLKLFWLESSRWIRVGLYLGMGWMSVFILPELWARLPAGGIAWLAAGGAAYTLGAIVYGLKWPDPFPEVFGFHEIWHFFVLAGVFCHFFMMKNYVLPL